VQVSALDPFRGYAASSGSRAWTMCAAETNKKPPGTAATVTTRSRSGSCSAAPTTSATRRASGCLPAWQPATQTADR
jgi:hypothetical protein